MTHYFKTLFTSSEPSWNSIEKAIRFIEPRVTKEMNDYLNSEFGEGEIKKAAFDISATKAPGPDGFSAAFFHASWPTIKDDVINEAKEILNNGHLMDSWNETTITLIPKVKKAEKVKDFRPISLCNVTYKIIAKALANRWRRVLDEVIDPNQSAFIPGRLISDNILIGFECMHWLRCSKSKQGYAALKLDMSKAYDRVEWRYVEAIMLKLGFSRRWTDLILNCMSSVSYRIKLNGELSRQIRPTRGIRQGDPLSPYIFVICAQGLSSLITGNKVQGTLKGLKLASRGPEITHLFFADDSLVFFKADPFSCCTVKECLVEYEAASGQVINYDKSALSFSPYTLPCNQDRVKQVLKIRMSRSHQLYLGAPSFSLRNKRIQFAYLKDNMRKKVEGWKHKHFSKGGKETLIKSVLQAVPVFAMSCFRVPTSICKELESICARF